VLLERSLRLLEVLEPRAQLQQQDTQLPGDTPVQAMPRQMRKHPVLCCLAPKITIMRFPRLLIEIHIEAPVMITFSRTPTRMPGESDRFFLWKHLLFL